MAFRSPDPRPKGYVPRLGERPLLHEVVRENIETFLAEARERSEHGFGVPRFVEKELRGFVSCGSAGRPALDSGGAGSTRRPRCGIMGA